MIVFLWCVCFGFFGVMGYLDDTMVTSPILAGLMAALVVYCAIEWSTKKRVQAARSLCSYVARIIREFLLACVQMLHRTRAYLTAINLPARGSITKRSLTANKPSVSSKSLP